MRRRSAIHRSAPSAAASGWCRSRVESVPAWGARSRSRSPTAAISKATPINGMLEPGELEDKFRRLTRAALGEPGGAALFERLQSLEDEVSLDWLGAQP